MKEYESFLADLQMVRSLGIRHLPIYSDPQLIVNQILEELIVNQILEEYQTKDPKMEKYLAKSKGYLPT